MSVHSTAVRRLAALFLALATACGDSSTAPQASVAAVRVTPAEKTLFIGTTIALSARLEDAGGRPLQGRPVAWTSSSNAIASVSAAGVVTANAPGVAQITATSEEKSGTATIVVTAVPPAVHEIAIGAGGATIVEGDSRALTVKLWDADGNELFGRSVAWTTDNPNVGLVTAAGMLEAKSPGPLVITAVSEGKSNSVAVTVVANPAPVASVIIEPLAAAIEEGHALQMAATPKDAAGHPVTGRGLQWSSSDATIASVAPLGLVTAIRPGTATITVKVDGKTASAEITVSNDYAFDLLYDGWSGIAGEGPKLYTTDLRSSSLPSTVIPLSGAVGIWAAAPSPDGTKIAFSGYFAGAQRGIYVVNRDGSGLKRLTTNDDDNQPAWSPDGTKIAFRRWEMNDDPDIWVVPAEGGAAVNLTGAFPDHAGEQAPAWSPKLADGKYYIAYTRVANGRAHIYKMTENGEQPTAVTTGDDVYDDTPAWSPDGSTILFQRHAPASFGDLWLVAANGTNQRMLMPFADPAGPQWAPAWSPDGKLIAFASRHETAGTAENVYQIYTVWSDGTRLARRTAGAAEKQRPAFIKR